jgi:hypothetical protein
VARVHCLAQRSGRAKRQSQRLLVFQGMRALKTYGDRKSNISKVSRNVGNTVTGVTCEHLMQRLINQADATTVIR